MRRIISLKIYKNITLRTLFSVLIILILRIDLASAEGHSGQKALQQVHDSYSQITETYNVLFHPEKLEGKYARINQLKILFGVDDYTEEMAYQYLIDLHELAIHEQYLIDEPSGRDHETYKGAAKYRIVERIREILADHRIAELNDNVIKSYLNCREQKARDIQFECTPVPFSERALVAAIGIKTES